MKYRKPYIGWRKWKATGQKIYDVMEPGDTIFFGPGNKPEKWWQNIFKPIYSIIRFFSKSLFHHVVKCEDSETLLSVEPPKAKRIGKKVIKKQGLMLIRRPVSYLTDSMISTMGTIWDKEFNDVSYDEGQLFNIMFHKLLGYGKSEVKKFHAFEEGNSEVVCSVGVALLDRKALMFDPVPGIDKDLIDPGMLETSKMYVDIAVCRGENVIKAF